ETSDAGGVPADTVAAAAAPWSPAGLGSPSPWRRVGPASGRRAPSVSRETTPLVPFRVRSPPGQPRGVEDTSSAIPGHPRPGLTRGAVTGMSLIPAIIADERARSWQNRRAPAPGG